MRGGSRPVALLAALELEASALAKTLRRADSSPRWLPLHHGRLGERTVVLAVGGVGKVAAAMATQHLCQTYAPSGVIGFGIAGAVADPSPQGQIVIASGAVQHDLDARPLTKGKAIIPGLGVETLAADAQVRDALLDAAARTVGRRDMIRTGTVLTGDQIVTTRDVRDRLAMEFKGAACIDMETAAMAQVAWQNDVPWGALRITSDAADESFDLRDVLGFGAHTAGQLFERIMREAVNVL